VAASGCKLLGAVDLVTIMAPAQIEDSARRIRTVTLLV
jgi:hypothetical protein